MPRFNFDELPPLRHSFTEKEKEKFTGELKSHFDDIRRNLVNDMSARYIINTFLSAAVSHIRKFVTDSVWLGMEEDLKGSRGYGPIDYVVKSDEIFLVLCEAKSEDMEQGMAQNIVQVHSVMERLSNSDQEEPTMYGIVTTGKLWQFVRWTGSLDKPVVHISQEYTCDLDGDFERAKKMVEYVAQILQEKADLIYSSRPSKRQCVKQGKES